MKISNASTNHPEAIIRGWVDPLSASASSGLSSIAVGTLSAGGSPFTVSSGTTYRAFPGAAWLTNPTATTHTTGDTFLVVYRDGTDHLTAGVIKGAICTVTATSPWTYTVGTPFTIETVANDLRPQGEGLSVLNIGSGSYRAVVWCNEYDGANNISPHVLICDATSATMTTSSTWTRHNVGSPFSGHTQDAANGRVHQLSTGTYMMAGQYVTGGVTHTVVLSTATVTDWSAPTMVDITSSGYNECDIEEMPDGTLIAHLREAAQVNEYESKSSDHGATWSAPALLYAAGGYPTWKRLNSGAGLTVFRDMGAGNHTAWRQTTTASTDTGWGASTILDSSGGANEYAAILQLDDHNALVIYAYETSSTDCDIYSQVFTDTSSFPTGGKFRVSSPDTTAGFAADKIVAGTGTELVVLNPGGNEQLQISVTGVGSVTSVGLTVPAEFSVTGSPVTGSGTLAVTKANESANTVWAGPTSGAAAAPTFRALVAADIPAGISGSSDHEHVMDCLFSGDGATLAWELPVAPVDAYSVAAYVAGTLTEVTLSGAMLTTATFGAAPGAATNNVRFDIVAAVT